LRVGVDRGVTDEVEDDGAATLSRRGREGAEQRPGQAEGPHEVGRQSELELLAFGIGKQGERDGSEARGIVDEDVEAAQPSGDLQGDGVDVLLARHVPDDAVRPGNFACHKLEALPSARDEGDCRAAAAELANQRQAQPCRAAGDRNPQGGLDGGRFLPLPAV
jgi:hypothetical protein